MYILTAWHFLIIHATWRIILQMDRFLGSFSKSRKATDINFWTYVAQFFLEWEMFHTNLYIKPQHTFWVFFFKSCRLWESVEKLCWAEQTTDNNMAHAHGLLDKLHYKHTHSDCVIHIAFPLQQWLDARVSLLTWYLHCLSCQVNILWIPCFDLS